MIWFDVVCYFGLVDYVAVLTCCFVDDCGFALGEFVVLFGCLGLQVLFGYVWLRLVAIYLVIGLFDQLCFCDLLSFVIEVVVACLI